MYSNNKNWGVHVLNRLNIISILEAGEIFSFKKNTKRILMNLSGPESYMKPLLCDFVIPGVE